MSNLENLRLLAYFDISDTHNKETVATLRQLGWIEPCVYDDGEQSYRFTDTGVKVSSGAAYRALLHIAIRRHKLI